MKNALLLIFFIIYFLYGVLFNLSIFVGGSLESINYDKSRRLLIYIGMLPVLLLFLSTFPWVFKLQNSPNKRWYLLSAILFIVSPLWFSGCICIALNDFSLILFIKRAMLIAIHAFPLAGCFLVHIYKFGPPYSSQ